MPQMHNLFPKILISTLFILASTPAKAQITPDQTLGAERSRVTPNTLINGASSDLINGGAQRGSNLFHSFTQFNITDGQRVYFGNPSGVQNILTRVTGGNVSKIFGTLGVNGSANLFLINPNGILFGKNASLDVRGSFVGTTANSVQFGNQGFFSATNPQAPPLLTVQPSALLFNQIHQGAEITNQSQAPAGVDLTGTNVTGLRVPDGKSLLLVGGNVSLDGGGLTANQGRVELAGLAAPGSVGLNIAGDTLSLSVPNDVQRGDISLTNQAFVEVSGAGKGDIAVNAGNLAMSNSSNLQAGINTGLGDGSTKGGDININADAISLTNGAIIANFTDGKGDAGNIFITASDVISLDRSFIGNLVFSREALGNAGNINIKTGSLSVTNGAKINSLTGGQGNAGDITIQARNGVTFDGKDGDGNFSALFNSVEAGGVGNGGKVEITADSLSLTNGALINADVREASDPLAAGKGNGGTVNINLRDALTISGSGSQITGSLGTGAIGRGGDIKVQAGNVFVRDGGEIISGTFGQGDSGNISVTARDAISLDKQGIYNNVQSRDAVGNAGKIYITTGSLSVTNGAQINSFTLGKGNAGDLTIQARNGVTFDGKDGDGNFSALSNNVKAGGVGNGGKVEITAGSLSLTNGGFITAGVREASNRLPGGKGIGGTVNIHLRDALTISGSGSQISGSLGTGAVGRGGDIKVQAGNVFVRDGGQIISSTFGQGDSGNISVTALNAVSLLDKTSYIINNVQSRDAVGNAGKIDINTGSLSLTNGAQINSFTRGQGNAGNITIQARDAVTFDGKDGDDNSSALSNNVLAGSVGNGGKVDITAGSLSLTNGGFIDAGVREASDPLPGGKGIGGNVNINVRDALTISGSGSQITGSLGTGAVGNAGKIDITTGSLSVTNGAEINSFTRGQGNAGNITIQARDAVTFDGKDGDGNPSGLFSYVDGGAVGHGGDINITANTLRITNSAGIYTDTVGQGNGGNITVEAKDLVEILNDSTLRSNVQKDARGNTGNITIKTGRLIVRNSQIGPSVFGEGNAGDFTILASDSVELSGQVAKREGDTSKAGSVGFPGGLLAQIDVSGKGRGGNLTIETRRLSVSDGSKIQAATFGDGDAGNVFIRADEIDLFETEKPNFFSTGIFAGVQTDGRVDAGIIDPRNGRPPVGKGGNLTIATRKLSLRNGGEIFVQTTGEGDAGKIFIGASDSINVTGVSTGSLKIQRNSEITAGASARSTGNGGSLTIETPLLNVADGGLITSRSDGKGRAGNIDIKANSLRLNNGKITAQTASSDGGNINFNLSQYLLLRNGSQISTTAGTAQSGGNGGNITINTPFIIAVPNENSDITANAFQGRGGNIDIHTQGIFGIEARTQPSDITNDITASSELGVKGQIAITQPNVDPTQGLVKLPNQLTDASSQITQICPRSANAKPLGEFIITGRGSLPPSPLESMTGTTTRIPLATLEETTATPRDGKITPVSNNQSPEIITAQGWIKTPDGNIILVAHAPKATPSSRPTAAPCPMPSHK